MKNLKCFLLAVLAGIAIGIGGIIYLTLDNKIIGSLMFAVGLYTIVTQELNLYTGKVGYLVDHDWDYFMDLGIIWLGNLGGTAIAAFAVLFTRTGTLIKDNAYTITMVKMNDSFISLFILGIFCGLLMFIAVDGYKKCNNPMILFACVSVFILCGFEHCVADMFYFIVSGAMNNSLFIRLLVITMGNTFGGICIPLVKNIMIK